MSRGKTDKNSGFSIIEVVITIAMVGLMLVVYQTSANTVVLNKGSNYQEIALRIASSKLQTLRTQPYASLPASGAFADSLLSSLPQGQGTLTVTDYNAKTKQIKATVSWRNPKGKTQQVNLETLITQGGLGQ